MIGFLQEGQPEDLQERKNWPWWKVSKWVLNIVYHLFNRYGSSKKHTKGSSEYQFYERWQLCSTQFLEDHMAIAIRIIQASDTDKAYPELSSHCAPTFSISTQQW